MRLLGRFSRRLVVIGLVGLVLFSSACHHPAAGDTTHITIAQWGQERYLIYLPLYVAMEKGLFAKRGITVDILYTGNDDQTFASVISGNAQFSVGDPVFTAISQERGFPAKVVATIVGGVAIWGVAKKQSVPVIDTPAGFAGLRVGTFPSPSTNYTLMENIIASNPQLLKKTKIVQAPIGSQLALLESGNADIAMGLEPDTSIAESQGYRVVYSSPKFHGPFAFTGLSTTEKFIQSKPDTVAKVVAALEEASVMCHHDPSIAVAVGVKLFPTLPKDVVSHAVSRMISEGTFPEHVVVSDDAWQAALKVRLAIGDLRKPQSTGVSVDNGFAQAAMAAER